jgi:AraC family transcriptional regulator
MTFAPVPARGHRLLHTRVNGLRFTYSRHREDVGTHAHEHPMLVLGCGGAFEERYTGRIRSATCVPGTVLVRPAGERHSNRFGAADARDVAIEIESNALERLRPWADCLGGVGSWRGPSIAPLARRFRVELELGDDASPLALEALALELLTWLMRSTKRANRTTDPVWLRRVREFIREEWRHRAIRLHDLAGVAGVHPAHVARFYRRRFGETPAGSIRRFRLEWAADQLARSPKRLAEVALEAGFADQSHFTRAFAARFGTTPGSFRRSSREG